MKARKTALRLALTAVLLGCLAVRAVRLARHWESVRRFCFPEDSSPFWQLFGFGALVLPLLLPIAAGVSLWRRGRAAARLGLGSALLAGLGILWEGLTLFARAMNGNSGYVGAEPALSLAVCLCAGAGLLLLHRDALDPDL